MINFDSSGSPLPAASSINGKFQHYADSINSNDKFNQLTYISSHDSNLARTSDMAYQGSALMLLPGAVQVFYGNETNRKTVPGMSFDGHGGSGHSLRSDMNWDSIDQDELTHCQKVFLSSRSNSAFCSPRCKNQYNVYKSRGKKTSEED